MRSLIASTLMLLGSVGAFAPKRHRLRCATRRSELIIVHSFRICEVSSTPELQSFRMEGLQFLRCGD